MSKFICKTVNYIFVFFISVFLITSCYGFLPSFIYSVKSLIIFVGIILALLVFIYFSRDLIMKACKIIRNSINRLSTIKMIIILSCFFLVTKISFVFILGNDFSDYLDMARYTSLAYQLADNGMIVQHADYAMRFQYTLKFSMLFVPFIKLFGHSPRIFLIVLTVLDCVSTVLVFDTVRRIVGKNTAFIGILIYNLWPVGFFKSQSFIHENGLYFFHLLGIWLCVLAFEYSKIWKKLVFLAVASVSFAVGSSMNANSGSSEREFH